MKIKKWWLLGAMVVFSALFMACSGGGQTETSSAKDGAVVQTEAGPWAVGEHPLPK